MNHSSSRCCASGASPKMLAHFGRCASKRDTGWQATTPEAETLQPIQHCAASSSSTPDPPSEEDDALPPKLIDSSSEDDKVRVNDEDSEHSGSDTDTLLVNKMVDKQLSKAKS